MIDKRVRKKADKREKIIQAAVKVFAHKGYHNARISDIAKKAKVADGTVYLYFSSKDELLYTLIRVEIGRLILDAKEIIGAQCGPTNKIKAFIRNHLEHVLANQDLAIIMQRELRQCHRGLAARCESLIAGYIKLISDIVRQGQETGVFRKTLLPGIAKRTLFGALEETARVWLAADNLDYSLEETTDQLCEVFVGGLLEARQFVKRAVSWRLAGASPQESAALFYRYAGGDAQCF